MTSIARASAPTPAFYTIAQIAERQQVATRTVRRWLKAGALVGHRFGAQWRVSAADLLAFERLNRIA